MQRLLCALVLPHSMSKAPGKAKFPQSVNQIEAQPPSGNKSSKEEEGQVPGSSFLITSGWSTNYVADNTPTWNAHLAHASSYDDELQTAPCGHLDSLHIYAGFFSGVITVFMIAVSKDHTDDLQREIQRLVINYAVQLQHASFRTSSAPALAWTMVLWFMSLIFSLLSAIGATFVKVWIYRYTSRPLLAGPAPDLLPSPVHSTVVPRRHLKTVVIFLAILLHVSFCLFLGGLIIHLGTNKALLLIPALLLGIPFLYGLKALFLAHHLNLLTRTSSNVATSFFVVTRSFFIRDMETLLPGPGGMVQTGPTTRAVAWIWLLTDFTRRETVTCLFTSTQKKFSLLLKNVAGYFSWSFSKCIRNAGEDHPQAETHAVTDKPEIDFMSAEYHGVPEETVTLAEKNFSAVPVLSTMIQEKVPNLTGRIGTLRGPLYPGGFSDVYSAQLESGHGSKKVAMKMLRIFTSEAHMLKAKKKFRKEVELWCSLKHPHVLPFYGTYELDGFRVFMVSPWAEGGNALEYLRRHPFADRRKLLLQTASALVYLHSGTHAPPIVHGDLKADNVLISASGNALLADFGLSVHVEEILSRSGSSSAGCAGGNARFMAPELLLSPKDQTENSRPTRESDVFSFSSLMLQIYTEKVPFSGLSREVQAIMQIATGKLPPRPTDPDVLERGLSDRIWDLMCECWRFNPSERPGMEDVRKRLMARGRAVL